MPICVNYRMVSASDRVGEDLVTANILSLDFPSTGRYRILILAGNDMLDKAGTTQRSLQSCADLVQKFPQGLIELVVVHPLKERFEWTDLPPCVKSVAEMRFHGLSDKEDAYEVFEISKESGSLAAVRPDGYVGMVGSLSAVDELEAYFRGCLVTRDRK